MQSHDLFAIAKLLVLVVAVDTTLQRGLSAIAELLVYVSAWSTTVSTQRVLQ